jgi:predicted transglutaminase-like cysteine proteinase
MRVNPVSSVVAVGGNQSMLKRGPNTSRSAGIEDLVVSDGVSLSSRGRALSSSYYDNIVAAAKKSGKSLKSQLYSNFFADYVLPYLIPSDSNAWSGSGLMDILVGAARIDTELLGILQSAIELKENQANFESSLISGSLHEEDYSGYLSRGDSELERIANEIVSDAGAVTDEEKVYAIMCHIQDNMKYVTDQENHGVSEYWSTARETVDRGSKDDKRYLYTGDCEDGAFFMMGLALAAGVDPDRLRFYGGLVRAGEGASTGGHGWLAFKLDNGKWTPTDWCYLASKKPFAERKSLAENNNYVGSWFVINGDGVTIDTTTVDAVNNPDCINKWDRYLGSGKKDYLFYNRLASSYLKRGESIPVALRSDTKITTALNGFLTEVGARGRLANLASAVNATVNISKSALYTSNAINAYNKVSYAIG